MGFIENPTHFMGEFIDFNLFRFNTISRNSPSFPNGQNVQPNHHSSHQRSRPFFQFVLLKKFACSMRAIRDCSTLICWSSTKSRKLSSSSYSSASSYGTISSSEYTIFFFYNLVLFCSFRNYDFISIFFEVSSVSFRTLASFCSLIASDTNGI